MQNNVFGVDGWGDIVDWVVSFIVLCHFQEKNKPVVVGTIW